MDLDDFDRRLLAALQKDASASLNDLAERVALSRTACWRRIQRLEEAGAIRARVALLDPAALGLDLTVYVLIKTNQHNRAWAERFSAVVEEIPEVLEAYRMSGDVDYLLKAVVADMKGYDRLYEKLIAADLFDVSSSFVMETLKHTTALPLERR
ncbi:MAG: Lrp/AsnC family transcriptional regulator [Pseudomonadales bacterium]|nr:Lrp/AsnC family transcriptional regulator [Pseudomonadales bacterium]